MKAAMRQVDEIDRVQEAIRKTKSPHLKKDYSKYLIELKRDLREYCGYKGLDYNKIMS